MCLYREYQNQYPQPAAAPCTDQCTLLKSRRMLNSLSADGQQHSPSFALPSQHVCPANDSAIHLAMLSTSRHRPQAILYQLGTAAECTAAGWTSATQADPFHLGRSTSLQPRLLRADSLFRKQGSKCVAALGWIPAICVQNSWAWRCSREQQRQHSPSSKTYLLSVAMGIQLPNVHSQRSVAYCSSPHSS